jgi:hypothetical protein
MQTLIQDLRYGARMLLKVKFRQTGLPKPHD